jgi:hypothetical protein
MGRRDDLAAFLRARRAAVEPAQVGLPPGGRRRSPGLRREEVALLAGVSATWYTWLEQGRPINASRSVLDALGRALLLDEAAHVHLLALARDDGQPVDLPALAGPPPDALVRLVDALAPAPAYVLGPRWEYLAWNRPQALLYPEAAELAPEDRNLLWIVLTRPAVRSMMVDWATEARYLVSRFRAETAAIRHDTVLAALVERLEQASPEFAPWWASHDVAGFHSRLRRYEHPDAGLLVFEHQQLTPDEWADHRIVVQLPVPGDDSAQRLAALG